MGYQQSADRHDYQFHMDVINQRFNHSNNIHIWIFIWRVTFIFNKNCTSRLHTSIFVNHFYKWKYLLGHLNDISIVHVELL